jgi:hypothetical protein
MRFFIHLFNGSSVICDPEGEEFPDLAAAVAEAVQGARDLIADQLRQGKPVPARWEARIADEAGAILKAISFAALVTTNDDLTAHAPTERPSQVPQGFAAAFASAKATAERSRSLNAQIQTTVTEIRAQLRALSEFKFG